MPITLNKEQYDALDEAAQRDFTLLNHGNEAVALPNALLATWGESKEEITGLKSALAKERDNAAEAEKQAKQLEHSLKDAGGASTEQLAAAQARADEIESNAAKELTALKKDLQTARVDREISDAILEHRGTAPLGDVLKTHVKVDDAGAAYVQVEDKKLSVSEYAASLKQDPVYHSVFQGSGNSGGGTPPGGAAGGAANHAPQHSSRGEMDASQKAAFISQHGIDKFMSIPA